MVAALEVVHNLKLGLPGLNKSFPQGLKPDIDIAALAARVNSRPDTNRSPMQSQEMILLAPGVPLSYV